MKIRSKILALLGLVVAVLTVLVTIVYINARNTLTDQINTVGMENAKNATATVDFYFEGLVNIINTATPALENMLTQEMEREQVLLQLASLKNSNRKANVAVVYIALNSNGQLVADSRTGATPPPGFDARTREWYQKAVETGDVYITTPYASAPHGDSTAAMMTVITLSKPLISTNGKLLGVLAMDVNLSTLQDVIAPLNVMEMGSGLLIDKNGGIVQHPNNGLITSENITRSSANISESLTAIGTKMLAREQGYADYKTPQGENERIFFSPSKSGYIVAVFFPSAQIQTIVNHLARPQLIAGSLALLAIIACTLFIIPSITRPIAEIGNALSKLATLDLRWDASNIWLEKQANTKTEIGAMAKAAKDLYGAISEITATLTQEINDTNSVAQKLAALASMISSSMQKTQKAVDNVANSASSSTKEIMTTERALSEVSNAVSMTASSAVEGAEASANSSRLSQTAVDNVNHVLTELAEIGTVARNNSNSIETVGASVATISSFVTTIRNIADQTNLLALNAAIEAARAGETGRGFAVVADEVRKLAEESNSASHEISELIEKLQGATDESITSSRESSEKIDRIIEHARGTQAQLDQALTQIAKVNDAMQTIAATAEEQAASSSEISHSINHVSQETQTVADEITMVEKSVQDTANEISNLAEESQNLNEVTEVLQNLMNRFTTEETDVNRQPLFQLTAKK